MLGIVLLALALQAPKEAALGKQLADEVRRQTTPVKSAAAQSYLDRLGRRLAPDLTFTFAVIADDACPATHHPTALPGGYIFVPAALFQAAQDEAEFAAVLAHAMAHIVLRHGIRAADRGMIFTGGCAEQAVPPAVAAAWRNNELEADKWAVAAAAKAGFDPQALWHYIDRVRPPAEDRLAVITEAIGKLPPAEISSSEFQAVQQELRRPAPPRKPPSLFKTRDSTLNHLF